MKTDGGSGKHRTGELKPLPKTEPLLQGMTRQAFEKMVELAAPPLSRKPSPKSHGK